MIENKNNFSVIKKHENPIHSSVTGNMTELLQLCQNDVTQENFYTYEVLDSSGSIMGGRLFYHFKNSEDALKQWDTFIHTREFDPSIEVSIIKEHFPMGKKLKY
jgi:hypothetical protein